MSDEKPPPSLEDLDVRLRNARRDAGLEPDSPAQAGNDRGDMGLGLRIAVELVAGVVFGLLIGLAIDHWLGTRPWGLIVMVFLGAIAGFMNVYRAASGHGYAAGFKASRTGRGATGSEPPRGDRGEGE